MAEQAPTPHRAADGAGVDRQHDAPQPASGLDQAPTVQRLREAARTLNARPAGPAQRGAAAFASRGVVQAKFKYLDTVLAEKDISSFTIPARLTPYRTSEKIYQIRDDWDADFTKPMHLVAPDNAYLVGEFHDRSTWAAQTAKWTRIAKSREGAKSFPGYEPAEPDKQDLPLDSMHAFLLHVALLARGQLLLLKADTKPIPPPSFGKEIVWAMTQIMDAEHGYKQVAEAIAENDDAEGDAAESAFVTKFTGQYVNSASIMKQLAEQLVACAAVKTPDATVTTKAADLKELLVGEAEFLAKLAIDLAAMSGIKARSAKGRAIATEARSTSYIAPAASTAMGVREAAMAANIKSAGTPLIVQIGDGHVENVAGLVPGSVKVRADDTLAKHTKV